MLDEQCHKKHQGQEHAAEPPSHRRPVRAQGRILQVLKEENAGGRQDRAGE